MYTIVPFITDIHWLNGHRAYFWKSVLCTCTCTWTSNEITIGMIYDWRHCHGYVSHLFHDIHTCIHVPLTWHVHVWRTLVYFNANLVVREQFIFGNRSGAIDLELKVMFWQYELSFASCVWYIDWNEERMFETACCCFSLILSHILRHLSDLWPVCPWIISWAPLLHTS